LFTISEYATEFHLFSFVDFFKIPSFYSNSPMKVKGQRLVSSFLNESICITLVP